MYVGVSLSLGPRARLLRTAQSLLALLAVSETYRRQPKTKQFYLPLLLFFVTRVQSRTEVPMVPRCLTCFILD